ncbi:MAG: histidinol-phosphatase [bacterium]|nr:histidinol-phosphatase [bacterium]
MAYRYETHLHTCQGSLCGASTGAEHVRWYKEIGYQGIIITDHFFGGNTAVPRTGTWKERIDWFCSGYEDALIEGQKIGLDVFFGWEQGYKGDEYLVYGLDKQWLLNHPEVETWTRREQLEGVHRDGGCVIQAHPFRDRAYINRIRLARQFCDGIEVANAGNRPYNDAYALRYAREFGFICTAGSDNHRSPAANPMGIETEEKLGSIQDLVKLVRNRGKITPIVPEGWFEQGFAEAPQLETYWLDEDEHTYPTGRNWLAD